MVVFGLSETVEKVGQVYDAVGEKPQFEADRIGKRAVWRDEAGAREIAERGGGGWDQKEGWYAPEIGLV